MGQPLQIWRATGVHKTSTVPNDEVQGRGLNWAL